MADSDIIVGGLTAVGGIGHVALRWSQPIDTHTPGGLPYLQKSAVEVWAGPTNDRGAVTTVKIGEEGDANGFLHSGLARGETHYYWIRARNRAGRYGEWHPLSQTGGLVGAESNSQFLLSPTGYLINTNGLIEQWGYTTWGAMEIPNQSQPKIRRLSFSIPFPNELFNFTPVGGPHSELNNQTLIPVPILFSLDELTLSHASMFAITIDGTYSHFISLSDSAPIRWRAIGY